MFNEIAAEHELNFQITVGELSEKRSLTGTGACGVPQSARRISDISAAACAGVSRLNMPAQSPAASKVEIRCIVFSLEFSGCVASSI